MNPIKAKAKQRCEEGNSNQNDQERQIHQMIKEGRFNKKFVSSCNAEALSPSVIIEEELELLAEKIKRTNHLPSERIK